MMMKHVLIAWLCLNTCCKCSCSRASETGDETSAVVPVGDCTAMSTIEPTMLGKHLGVGGVMTTLAAVVAMSVSELTPKKQVSAL